MTQLRAVSDMATRSQALHLDIDVDQHDVSSGRESSLYSPASSYSTYSREVKYIFDPIGSRQGSGEGESGEEEYPDYSHIDPRAVAAAAFKQSQHKHHQHQQPHKKNNNLLAHTPSRTISAASSSHLSDDGSSGNKENRPTPNSSHHQHQLNNSFNNARGSGDLTYHPYNGVGHIEEDEDSIFEPTPSPSKAGYFQYPTGKHHSSSGGAYPHQKYNHHQHPPVYSPRHHHRGPISPDMEETLYLSPSSPQSNHNLKQYHHGNFTRKQSTMSENSFFTGGPGVQRGATGPRNTSATPDRNMQAITSPTHRQPPPYHYHNNHNQLYNQQQQFSTNPRHPNSTQWRGRGANTSTNHNSNNIYNNLNSINSNSVRVGATTQPPVQANDPRYYRDSHVYARSNASNGMRSDIATLPKSTNFHSYHVQNPNLQHYQIDQKVLSTFKGNTNTNQHYWPQQQHPQQQQHQQHQQQPQQNLPQPPYPAPPKYSYQSHRRRKTWSPPAMRLSLPASGALNSSSCSSSTLIDNATVNSGSVAVNIGAVDMSPKSNGLDIRPFYSNDSLPDYLCENDVDGEAARAWADRKAHSLSEDLDVTPPRLAPVSGVLSQKPGPNLIKPIAFRPSHGVSPARTPVSLANETTDSTKGPVHPQPQLSPQDSGLRSSGTKLGASSLSGLGKGSPDDSVDITNGSVRTGAFRQADKPQDGSSNNESRFNHTNQTAIAHNPSSPQAAQHPSSTQNTQNTADNGGVYKNIVPDSTYSMHNQQGAPDVNTSYSSFNGEFPLTEGMQSTQPSNSTNNVPQASYQSNQQQRGVETSMLQTPSPSDSGVGEHEAVLREKDAEINTLREVMDRNERAIFQVHEERRHVWINDTRKLQDDYERKLKVQSRKSYKTEQVLSLQVYKLQQEQRALQEEKAKVAAERDSLSQRLSDSQTEISSLRSKLGFSPDQSTSTAGPSASSTGIAESSNGKKSPSPASPEGNVTDSSPAEPDNNDKVSDNMNTLQKELLLKNKELIQLHSKLAGLEADLGKANRELTDKAREIVSGSDKIRSLQDELHRVKNPPQLVETGCQTHAVASQVDTTESLVKPSLLGERDRTIEGLQEEMLALRTQLEEVKTQHEEERTQWLDEKNKVVRYQKQLQLNYVQMQRKNCTLETEVQQLTLELENRELKLVALNGEESVC